MRKKVSAVFLNLFMVFAAVTCILPFWWVFVMSTFPAAEQISTPPMIPKQYFLVNLKMLFDTIDVGRTFLNSLFLASIRTLLTVGFSSLSGFSYAKYQFKGKNIFFMATLITMFVPSQLAWIGQIKQYQSWGILNTYYPIILGSMGSAFGIIVLRGYIERGVSDSILDAARIDGSSEFGLYWRMTLPLIKPALASIGILSFISSWNDYSGILVLIYSPEKYTLPLAMNILQSAMWNNIAAQSIGIILSLFPIMTVYFSASRQFIAALTAGAVKE